MLRKPKPRPRVYPENDVYFLDAESLRKILGYSRWFFYRWIISNGVAYGIPPCVILGPTTDLENLRWRADELYALRPDLSPYPPDSCWLARFKSRAAVDRESYIAQREAERSVRAAAA
jgi:hypothetical protein